jgi:CRP-like cAMP-binding protein
VLCGVPVETVARESVLDLSHRSTNHPSANHLLASLPSTDFEFLRPHLRSEELVDEVVLARAGDELSRVYFPESGIISLVVSLSEGETIEVAMIGRDSFFGASVLYDGGIALNDAMVQLPGAAWTLDLLHFREAAEHSRVFRETLARHEQSILIQAQQSAACNAYHSVESRLSRWLLRVHDLFDSDKLPLTQGFLAEMIGVQRNSVSVVAHTLQQAGLIRYRRGCVEIVNLKGLMKVSCECHETVKTRCAALSSPDSHRRLRRGGKIKASMRNVSNSDLTA